MKRYLDVVGTINNVCCMVDRIIQCWKIQLTCICCIRSFPIPALGLCYQEYLMVVQKTLHKSHHLQPPTGCTPLFPVTAKKESFGLLSKITILIKGYRWGFATRNDRLAHYKFLSDLINVAYLFGSLVLIIWYLVRYSKCFINWFRNIHFREHTKIHDGIF